MSALLRNLGLLAATIVPLFAAEPGDVWGLHAGLSFEPNLGQTDESVRYLARTPSGIIFFTGSEIVLHRQSSESTVRFKLEGSDPKAGWEPSEPTGATTSYYIGRDPKKWAENVGRYRRLTRRSVYPGIDIVYYGNTGRLEYDFVLAPHADASRIRMQVDGARAISLASDGALVIQTSAGELRQHKPALYQTLRDGSRRAVDGSFRLLGKDTVGFLVAEHAARLALSIDPVLESSSYFGGSSEDRIVGMNSSGSVVGTTASIDFPGAAFARRKGADIFVSSGPGPGTATTTVIGGSGDDQVTSAFVGETIVIGGYTDSRDLPTNQPVSSGFPNLVWQPDFAGGATDGFVLVITFNGRSTSNFLTYVGTPGDDRVTGVASTGFGTFAVVGATNGAGLPTSVTSQIQPFQPAPTGGVDGFFITATVGNTFVVNGAAFTGPVITSTSYLGGSGDDRPLAILAGFSSDYYIAGETNSADFPLAGPQASQRSGDSDAFLMHIFPGSLTSPATIAASTLFGGGGRDRGVALSQTAAGISLAGVTSSNDLPLVNPVQRTYGGGASDAFLAQFSADLSKIVASTYLGGSGTDEATALAPSSNSFIAGWTTSRDFPVTNALQSQFGGGPDDGFLVQFDTDGSVQQATYFGGSGSDRILSLASPGFPTIWLAGETSSSDLPLQDPWQPELHGSTDGFIARISSSVFTVAPTAGGKDLRVQTSVGIGNAPLANSTSITITSSDPSKIVVAADYLAPGRASATLPPSPGSVFRAYYLDCLDDQGGADLTFSAPGYPSATAHVSCFPASLSLSGLNPFQTRLWTLSTIFARLAVFDPEHPSLFPFVQSQRPGADPIQPQISSSNPAVGTIVNPNPVPSASSSFSWTFQPVAEGETELRITAPGIPPGPFDRLKVVVGPAVTVFSSLTVPSGFETSLALIFGNALPDPAPTATITSGDPARVVLSLDPEQAGSGSISMPITQSSRAFYVQALASSGDVPITISVPGQSSLNATVHLAAPSAILAYSAGSSFAGPSPLSLAVGATASVYAGITGPGINGLFAGISNPGKGPLSFTLTSSNPSVLSVVTENVSLSRNNATAIFGVRALSDGTANLSLKPPDGIPLDSAYRPLPVEVKTKPLSMPDIELGKDLAGSMTLLFPGVATSSAAVKITSSNPSLVLLSPDTTSAGQAQITSTVNSGALGFRFFVYGMAESGQVKITADVAGYATVSATVTLDPSGFGWAAERYTAALYNLSSPFDRADLAAFVLDAATLVPVGTQTLRPGVSASLKLVSTNPEVVDVSPSTLSLSSANTFQWYASLALKAAGNSDLFISQPPGFSAPAFRSRLPVTVLTPVLQPLSTTLAKDTQGILGFGGVGPNNALPLTVTSSDPSRLLISADANAAGSASVTVSPPLNHPIFLQALDSQGSVTVTASMPNYKDGTATMNLAALGIALGLFNSGFDSGATITSPNVYATTTQSPRTKINLVRQVVDPATGRVLGPALLPRPGSNPVSVEVRSSNLAVGTIVGSPVRLPNDNSQAVVEFQPLAVGQSEVSVVQPPDFVAPSDGAKATFNVSLPGFTAANVLIGRDTFGQVSAGLIATASAPDTNVTVTIASADPARVLLAKDQDSEASPSITKTLVAGQRSVNFYIHALGNDGTVAVKITAPGYGGAAMTVALSDTQFYFLNPVTSGVPINAVVQRGPQKLQIGFTPAVPKNLPPNYSYPGLVAIRPGAAEIPITVNSSDPGIVAVDNPQVMFSAGFSTEEISYRPVNPGQAVLSLAVPGAYLAHPTQGQAVINVQASKLTMSFFGASFGNGTAIGRDLQGGGTLGSEDGLQQTPVITVSSSDPSRLLLSTSATAPGQPRITIDTANRSAAFYAQSLSDNGTAIITASADGYQSTSVTISLIPSAAVFLDAGNQQQDLFTNSPPRTLTVQVAPVDPATSRPSTSPFNIPTPRPGANLSVTVVSSDPKVLTTNKQSLQFSTDVPQQNVEIRPAGIGTAILTLGLLPGGVPPASGRQIVFNVTEPDLFIPNFSLGVDLQVPVQVTLAGRLPAPSSDLTLLVDESGVAISNDPSSAGNRFEIPVGIPAGQRTSRPFYVQIPFLTGGGSLSVAGGAYTTSRSTVTVTPTAFVFQEASQAQPVSVFKGVNFGLTILPVLSPLGTPAVGAMSIRAGALPITVSVTSSNPNVLAVATPQVIFRPGDQRAMVNLSAVSTGTATLKLSGTSAYDFSTVQSSINVSVK